MAESKIWRCLSIHTVWKAVCFCCYLSWTKNKTDYWCRKSCYQQTASPVFEKWKTGKSDVVCHTVGKAVQRLVLMQGVFVFIYVLDRDPFWTINVAESNFRQCLSTHTFGKAGQRLMIMQSLFVFVYVLDGELYRLSMLKVMYSTIDCGRSKALCFCWRLGPLWTKADTLSRASCR